MMKQFTSLLLALLMLTLCWTSPAHAASATHDSTHARYTARKDIPATCTRAGSKGGMYCNLCKRFVTQGKTVPALGHSMKERTIGASCGKEGQRVKCCTRCGLQRTIGTTPALVHWYGAWQPNGDGTHTARCRRSGCRKEKTVECEMLTAFAGGQAISICPVCGWTDLQDMIAVRWQVEGSPAQRQGDLVCFAMMQPAPGVRCAFTLCREIGGSPQAFESTVTLTLPLSMPQGARLVRGDTMEQVHAQSGSAIRIRTDRAGMYLVLQEEK